MWTNPQKACNFFTYSKEMLSKKLDFLCSVIADELFDFI